MTTQKAFDGRSSRARRLRKIAREIGKDFGDALGVVDRALVDQAAFAIMRASEIHQAIMNGEDGDPLVASRLSNSASRTMAMLAQRHKITPRKPQTLDEYLATP